MFVSQIFEECAEILGTTNNEKVFRKITQAVQTLMESGHWTHSTAEVDVCTGWDCMSVTLPRGVDTPLAINVDGSPVYFRNRLFQYHVNKGGQYSPVTWAWDDRGYTATAMEILQPSQLVAIAEVDNDVGKELRVIGSNANNVPLRSQLKNGALVDGVLVPIHSKNDFPYGVVLPDDATIESRSAKIEPLTKFTTSTPHTLNAGQGATLNNLTGVIPATLSNGQRVYIGIIDAVTIQLYNDQNNAEDNNFPIKLQSIVNSGTLQIKDQRYAQVVTAISLTPTPEIGIGIANPVAFPPNQVLPIPLQEKITYFANLVTPTQIQVFKTYQDAQNNKNPVYTTGSTSPFQVDIRKEIVPETKFTFSAQHYYQNGDLVQVFTSGGTLPTPLIANQNYFVSVIDAFNVSLHENQSDAVNSTPSNTINPIRLLDAGSGTNFVVKLIPSTFTPGDTSQVTAPGLNIAVPTGSGAEFQAVVTGSVRTVQITQQGSGYITVPTVTFSAPPPPPVGSGQQVITAQGYAILNNISQKIEQIIITNPGLGYIDPPDVQIGPASATPITVNVSSITLSGTVATVITATDHGFVTGQIIEISGANQAAYNTPGKSITKISNNEFTYTVSGSPASPATGTITATFNPITGQATATAILQKSFVSSFVKISGGSGYVNPPQVVISGGNGTGATAVAVVNNGEVTALQLVTSGTGYTTDPAVTVTPSTGVFVEFSSTGTLPNPLVQGNAYRAESPLNPSTGVFTIKNTNFSSVTLTGGGSGTFYTVLSRSFGVTFTNRWLGNFSSVPNGQEVYFASDFSLPVTSPSISPTVPRYFNVLSAQIAKAYTSQAEALAGGTTGLIQVNAFGVGQLYYGLRFSASAGPLDSSLMLDSNLFIENDEIVRFSTSGTLPLPLVSTINYKVRLFGNGIQIYNLADQLVSLGSSGVGQLFLNIERTITPSASTKIVCETSLFTTGQSVTVRAKDLDVLPSGLLPNTTYYVRSVDQNSFELYNTLENAKSGGTTGKVSFRSTGNTVDSEFFVDALDEAVFVKSISQIEKPLTDGYVSLYAWDYGRSNDMTLIGQYHPNEINPQYRRIRIGKACGWVRIAYRMSSPKVTSLYDYIPIEHERAIIAAIHAVDMEDKDFAEQAARYWGIAFQYLRNQQEYIDGHAMTPPQINNITYGDGTDPVIF